MVAKASAPTAMAIGVLKGASPVGFGEQRRRPFGVPSAAQLGGETARARDRGGASLAHVAEHMKFARPASDIIGVERAIHKKIAPVRREERAQGERHRAADKARVRTQIASPAIAPPWRPHRHCATGRRCRLAQCPFPNPPRFGPVAFTPAHPIQENLRCEVALAFLQRSS